MKYAVSTLMGASLLLAQQGAWAHHGHLHEVSYGTLVGVVVGLMTIGIIAALAAVKFGFGESRQKRALAKQRAQAPHNPARAIKEER
ncbi:MAG: hypothetical protein AAGF57_15645 [Pseudomonadota bacterium]